MTPHEKLAEAKKLLEKAYAIIFHAQKLTPPIARGDVDYGQMLYNIRDTISLISENID